MEVIQEQYLFEVYAAPADASSDLEAIWSRVYTEGLVKSNALWPTHAALWMKVILNVICYYHISSPEYHLY